MWKLTKYLSVGGNGEVWLYENDTAVFKAIKILKKIKAKPYSRFKD
jgi:hypothetical protein